GSSLFIVGIIVVAELAAEAPTSPTLPEGVLQVEADGNARHLDLERPNASPRPAPAPPPPASDVYQHAGLPPQQAAKVMTVPEGFSVQLFAGEPDIHQPIAMCLDDRGRMWVAEAYTYPRRHPHREPLLPDDQKAKGDRILIFED